MSQSYVQLYVHIVFHTKYSKDLINYAIEDELYSYIGGVLKSCGSLPIKIGGVSDHVHVLCSLPKTMSVSELSEEIKKSSSKWIKTKGPAYSNFYWRGGYGGFSVGWSQVDMVKGYILNQKIHHRRVSFIEEYKTLMDENGVEYDEKYL
jgi:putative transposase